MSNAPAIDTTPSSPPSVRPPVVKVGHLYKAFGDHAVLVDVNLTLYGGENLVVLGKSGSGKSVLIKCLVGLLPIDAGQVQVLGKSIPDLDHDALDELRREIGFLFQWGALYDSMTVRENMEFPLRKHSNWTKARIAAKVEEVLASVGLPEAVDLMPVALSGGMKKRIALARTLMLEPKIILYDEPTSGLDPITAKEISELIRQVQQKYQAAAIIITHDIACARIAGDRIVILSEGTDYAEGDYTTLSQSADPVTGAFFQ